MHYEKGFVRFAEKATRQKFYEGQQVICANLQRPERGKEEQARGREGRAKVGIKGGAGGPLPWLAFQSGLSVAVVLIVIVAQMEIVLSF